MGSMEPRNTGVVSTSAASNRRHHVLASARCIAPVSAGVCECARASVLRYCSWYGKHAKPRGNFADQTTETAHSNETLSVQSSGACYRGAGVHTTATNGMLKQPVQPQPARCSPTIHSTAPQLGFIPHILHGCNQPTWTQPTSRVILDARLWAAGEHKRY